MEQQIHNRLKALIWFTLLSFIMVIGIFIYDIFYINHTPDYLVRPAASSDLDIRVQNLESNLENLQQDLVNSLNQKLYYFSSIALLISGIAAFFGWRTFNDLDKLVREKVNGSFSKALYQLDPTNLKIWIISFDKVVIFKGDNLVDKEGKPVLDERDIPKREIIESNVKDEMEKAAERIVLTGLKNIKKLPYPDHRCYDGVTIVPVFDKGMEREFQEFLERNNSNLEPKRAAFVLYTRDFFVSQTKTLAKYSNLATANMLPTVASMILTVGRGLSDPNQPETEGK